VALTIPMALQYLEHIFPSGRCRRPWLCPVWGIALASWIDRNGWLPHVYTGSCLVWIGL
jgi:hypothetical protein